MTRQIFIAATMGSSRPVFWTSEADWLRDGWRSRMVGEIHTTPEGHYFAFTALDNAPEPFKSLAHNGGASTLALVRELLEKAGESSARLPEFIGEQS